MNLPAGRFLQKGKYQLLHVVGQGGFGITYKGILFTEVKGALGTIKTEVPISIKEYFFKDYCYRDQETLAVNVHSETGKLLFHKFKEKLIKEAKILSDVHHPNIVNVLDVFEENNTAYIAMEFISGHSLKYTLEKEGMLPEKKVLKYIHQIGKALQFVHENNILHLDIKPSNILIDKTDRARLIDFGVSKRYDVEDKETSTTMLTLSKGFASIEQYDNEGTQTFSPRPDIYSLGATMYNLLTGKIPTESILRATRALKKPSEINPVITQKTEEVIMKAMQINPADRFQTITEMLEALDLPEDEDTIVGNSSASASYSNGDDETTVLYSSSQHLKRGDDEQTIINDKPVVSHVGKKKKKKKVLILSLICIFAIIGSSVAFLLGHDKPADPVDLPSQTQEKKDHLPIQTDNNTITENNKATEEKDDTTIPAVENNRQEADQPVVSRPETNTKPEDNDRSTVEPVVTPVQLTAEEIEARYIGLISSGNKKMEANDFNGANKDFAEAYRVKPGEEAMKLIRESNLKMEEILTTERLAQYEEKWTFGRYRIVRKKSTQKYGAIDDKGKEVIACIYLTVDVADQGYAFQREDDLFDIYNSNAKLIKTVGVGSY